jgi:hypothetical protein
VSTKLTIIHYRTGYDDSDSAETLARVDKAFSYFTQDVNAVFNGIQLNYQTFRGTFLGAAPVWSYARHIYLNPVFDFSVNNENAGENDTEEVGLNVYFTVYSTQLGVERLSIGNIKTVWRRTGSFSNPNWKMSFYQVIGDYNFPWSQGWIPNN